MKKKKLFTSTMTLVIFTAICLSGCAGKNIDSEGPGSGSTGNEISAGFSFDWHTQTFAKNEKIEEDSALGITDFSLWEHDYTLNFYYGTDGTDFYTLEFDFQSETAENICLSKYDLAGKSNDPIMLSAEALAEDPSSLGATGHSILSPEEFAFLITSLRLDENGRNYPEQYRLIRMNSQGQILSDVDMLPLYESQGMLKAGTDIIVSDCILDGDNCIYTRNRSILFIADTNGNLLMEKDYGDERYFTIGDPVRSDDGKLIFPIRDGMEKTVRLVWFDAQNSKEYVLAELEYSSFQKLYAMRGRHIYYGTMTGIVDWDTESGKRSEIFRYKENAIPYAGNTMLAFDGEGSPLLRVVYEQEDMLLVLGEQEDWQDAIRIVDLSWSSASLIKENIAAFSRRNPLYHFSYEKPKADQKAEFRDRIMAELVSGAGPDILYLTREDMIILQEKGALADLEEFISQDTIQELLPGAVEFGRVNGSLSGIPGEVYPRTIFTSPEIWDAGSWSISDILDLIQNREQEAPVQAIIPTISSSQLYYLILIDLEHSAFIDWENNTCSFTTGEFASLLNILKTYSLNETIYAGDESWEMLHEEKILGVPAWYINFNMYQGYLAKNEGDIKALGFPSETGNGNYLWEDGIFAVNAKTANKEAVSAFLEYVLGIQGQNFCTFVSVRKNMITEDMVTYREDNTVWLKESSRSYVLLETGTDGSVYIRQYNEFLESCVPRPDPYDELSSIIEEEAKTFFEGGKTAEQTAEIIQRRVQLYLDEHK